MTGAVGGDVVACTGTASVRHRERRHGKTVTASGLTLTRRGGGQLRAVDHDRDDDGGDHGGDA